MRLTTDPTPAPPAGGLVVRSLGSGSSGNAFLVEARGEALLVDCGIGTRALRHGLEGAGLAPERLSAVLLSHEHGDHVRGLPLVSRLAVPILATAGTAAACRLAASRTDVVTLGRPVTIGAFTVTPLPVCHDAADPCAFHLATAVGRVTIVTDLGRRDEALHEAVQDADLVVLEANHDEELLRRGPYPERLRRRILSARGHLSNADCGDLLAAALEGRRAPAAVWLAHLSTTNNRPALAVRTVAERLLAADQAVSIVALPRSGAMVWRSVERERAPVQMPLPIR